MNQRTVSTIAMATGGAFACLAILGLIFGFYHLAPWRASNDSAPRPRRAVTVAQIDWCAKGLADITRSQSAYSNHDYRQTRQLADDGLSIVGRCDRPEHFMLRAILTGMRGFSEHAMGDSDDADVDIDLAITLLTQCESEPGLYATRDGAECQSLAESIEKAKISWEMNP